MNDDRRIRNQQEPHWPVQTDAPPSVNKERTYTRADLEAFAKWVLHREWSFPGEPESLCASNAAALVEAWEKEKRNG